MDWILGSPPRGGQFGAQIPAIPAAGDERPEGMPVVAPGAAGVRRRLHHRRRDSLCLRPSRRGWRWAIQGPRRRCHVSLLPVSATRI